ncbi:MAG: response regulator [Pseudomonadota bacterium]
MTNSHKQILLVEDEENISIALSFLIKREGYDLECVSDGEEAIAALDASRPDLVVLDAMIPGISGYGVCQHIRESAALQDMKILMISAAGESARRRALEIGADAFLLKPFDTRLLTAKMRDLLESQADA